MKSGTSLSSFDSLLDLKDVMSKSSPKFVNTADLSKAYLAMPSYDTLFLQTGAVTLKTTKGSVILPTLLSFDRTSKALAVDNFADLVTALHSLSVENLASHEAYSAKVKLAGKIVDHHPGMHRGYLPEARNRVLFVLAYPQTSKQVLFSWKNTPWSSSQCKDFLADKGFIKMPRYSTTLANSNVANN